MPGGSGIIAPLIVLACASSTAWASKKVFNIHDDLLAFPQYQVLFPEGYLLESHARELLYSQQDESSTFSDEQRNFGQNQAQIALNGGSHGSTGGRLRREEGELVSYEEMDLEGQRYLCRIPHVDREDPSKSNGTQESTEAEEKRELARATDRGMELLREMEGKCMYYVSGWWSYSFCYKNQVKQFHALPSGSGIPNYPPMEDPTTHSFILGRFPRSVGGDDEAEDTDSKKTTALAELQTKGGSRYLVQRLDGGTRCDLTGRNRKIEVQFHCHPQSTDRIGWIKELTTCSYLMVIYTPRLCNDVAFLPPQQEEVHSIDCREILTPDEVPEWEAMQKYHMSQRLVESAETPEFPIVGDIQVGAQKLVGSEGKTIEKGRVASAGEEKVDTLAKRENGEIQRLSREELKKYDLDPEKVEELKRQMEEWAKGKDWTLEVVLANGERGLRGIVDTDSEESETVETTGKTQTQSTEKGEQAEGARQKDGAGQRQQTASTGDHDPEQSLEGEGDQAEDTELQMEQFYMVI
ncbi:hypothetical protein P170DRAFT_512905 [Aspergillus steynii IBT 23096]|uniref:Endoplasmic reticulum lectin n=1 Tax=Aspergillus steynii IBT 23096 TaxID=1392250 RepID=A0A2I2FVU7_9EURO|nr:uncharacterized protein P170DRAFT_512905 [Aspergillus steynii IBT 23096]PLB44751.1 hypothetical protein P170DRAFT_512905 [Aspergillus steynii IBT 23096]